jgi:hypothetical protein
MHDACAVGDVALHFGIGTSAFALGGSFVAEPIPCALSLAFVLASYPAYLLQKQVGGIRSNAASTSPARISSLATVVTACVHSAGDDMDMDGRTTTMDARAPVQRSQHSVQQNKQAAGDVHLVLTTTKAADLERSACITHASSNKWAVAVRSHAL